MAHFRFALCFWKPPTLTPEQEFEIGKRIVSLGRNEFIELTPFGTEEFYAQIERNRNTKHILRALSGLLGLSGMFALIVVTWPVLAILVVLGGLVSIVGLYRGTMRYRLWVDEMIVNYSFAVATPFSRESAGEGNVASHDVEGPEALGRLLAQQIEPMLPRRKVSPNPRLGP